jgi:hypothetical protein
VTSARHDTGHEHRGLAGKNESYEKGRLTEDQQRHKSIDESSRKVLNPSDEIGNDGGV